MWFFRYVNDITFKSSALRTHRDRARAMAIRTANEKAIALASELNMKTGKPLTINETSGGYFGSYRNSYGRSSMLQAQNSVATERNPNAELVEGTFAPEQITIDASVSVVFNLE